MLRWRLLLGASLIGMIVGLIWLDARAGAAGTWLFSLAFIVTLLAAGEVLWLLKAGGLHPLPSVVYGGSALIVASNAIPIFLTGPASSPPLEKLVWPLLALAVATLWAFTAELRRYQRPGGVIVQLSLAIFALVYVGLLMSFLLQLRLIGPTAGLIALAALVAVVKMGDTGAYATGRLIGRHKMAPVLSPGKTWEGAVGGIVFACLAAWLVFALLQPALGGVSATNKPAWGWLVYGVVVGIAGMLGDLAESMFKRDMGRKDSSAWLPGFGGVLDLIDSLIFAAPVAYLCWVVGLVGH